MKRFAIREISTQLFLKGDYVGAKSTASASEAKLWQRKVTLEKRIKELTYAWYCDQAHQQGLYTNAAYTGSGQAILSVLNQGTLSPVFELVEIDFVPTVGNATPISATVGNKPCGPISMVEVS